MNQMAEPELLQTGLDRLRAILPQGWTVEYLNRGGPPPDPRTDSVALVTVQSTNQGTAYAPLFVEAKRMFGPMDVARSYGAQLEMLRRAMPDVTVMVIAPWLDRRTREVLEQAGFGYLDMTGNVLLRIDSPGVFIRVSGSDRDPNPAPRRAPGLSGVHAGRLVRLLVDVAPPYRPSQLAGAANLTRPYVSRLLGSLEDRALLRRAGSAVVRVDWVGLLRARAERYSLLKSNRASSMVAPQGIDAVLADLRTDEELGHSIAITGPVAAAAVAPVAVGGQLMMYAGDPAVVAKRLGLLPAKSGADVVLLQASIDTGAMEGQRIVDGLPHVALSQLVLDSLTGTGRMPAEGEAVLDWMQRHEAEWRLPDIEPVLDRRKHQRHREPGGSR